jgi:peptidoglycan hydrolase CwlO-like protein
MENTTTPQAPVRKKDFRNVIYILLTTGLLGSLGYIWYDKTRQKQDIQKSQEQLLAASAGKDDIQQDYNVALSRMDSMATEGSSKDARINDLETEIKNKKSEINSLMAVKNRSEKEKATLRSKINELNGLITERNNRITELEAQNLELNNENQVVKTERDQVKSELETSKADNERVKTEKKAVEDQVDIGSTLSAFNFNITGIEEKRKGREKETTKAKRVDKLRISFDLDANRITTSGKKQLYILVTGPDGKPVTVEALGSGKFTTREEGEKFFTSQLDVDYVKGERKPVSFDWKQNTDFQKGDYQIEVYQNGFKIGNGKVTLRKSGLFG